MDRSAATRIYTYSLCFLTSPHDASTQRQELPRSARCAGVLCHDDSVCTNPYTCIRSHNKYFNIQDMLSSTKLYTAADVPLPSTSSVRVRIGWMMHIANRLLRLLYLLRRCTSEFDALRWVPYPWFRLRCSSWRRGSNGPIG